VKNPIGSLSLCHHQFEWLVSLFHVSRPYLFLDTNGYKTVG
jgi:hypothetical protein